MSMQNTPKSYKGVRREAESTLLRLWGQSTVLNISCWLFGCILVQRDKFNLKQCLVCEGLKELEERHYGTQKYTRYKNTKE